MRKVTKKHGSIDMNQTKISSFFTKTDAINFPANSTESPISGDDLNIKHNGSDDSNTDIIPDSLQDNPVVNSHTQLLEIRKKENTYFQQISSTVLQQDSRADAVDEMHLRSRPRMFDLLNRETKSCSNDIVLETQADISHELDQSNDLPMTSNFTVLNNFHTPDKSTTKDVIPDTPDPLEEYGQKKRGFSRSFLKPSSVAVSGIRRIPSRAKLRARRSSNSGPVSVSFSKQVGCDISNDSELIKSRHDSLSTSINSPDADSPSLIGVKYSVNDLCDPSNSELVTEPVKRSAKPGLSPDPKRLLKSLTQAERGLDQLEIHENGNSHERLGMRSRRRLCKGGHSDNGISAVDESSKENSNEVFDDDLVICEEYNERIAAQGEEKKVGLPVQKVGQRNDFKYQMFGSSSDATRSTLDATTCDDDRLLQDILHELQPSETESRVNRSSRFSLSKRKGRSRKCSTESLPSGRKCDEYSDDGRKESCDVRELEEGLSKSDREMFNVMDAVCGRKNELETGPDAIVELDDVPPNINKLELDTSVDIKNTSCNVFSECSADTSDKTDDREKGVQGTFGRHTVTDILRIGDSRTTLKVVDSRQTLKTCHLDGFWADTRVCVGDVIHLIDIDWSPDWTCSVDDKSGIIVVNPDYLISGTSVVSGVYCMRQAVLNYTFKGCDGESLVMLCGSIIHALFQTCLQRRVRDASAMRIIAASIVTDGRFLHDLYRLKAAEEDVMKEVEKYIDPFIAWINKYTAYGRSAVRATHDLADSEIIIQNIRDVEENIWSPRFGIKGKIDVSAEVKIHKKGQLSEEKVVPLELKTGKASYSAEHQGQVTLYTLMMSDRGPDPAEGLLLYLKDGSMKTVATTHANTRGLIQLRNELASYVLKKVVSTTNEAGEKTYHLAALPEPVDSRRMCERCPQIVNCAAYLSLIEQRPLPTSHTMTSLVPESLAHLRPSHLDYFKRWCLMLELEAGVDSRCKPRGIWTQTAKQREKNGEGLSDLVVSCTDADGPLSQTDYRRTSLTFTRTPEHPPELAPLTSVGIAVGDNLVVSAQNEALFALTMGQVTSLTHSHVTLLTDKDVSRWCTPGRRFRLDKCDVYSMMSSYFTNLSILMANSASSERLRRLIIDRETAQLSSTLSKKSIEKVKKLFQPLNKPQKTVVLKALMTKDYILIKGFPGTGKTSTIVGLVKILQALGHSVLLTSYTHSAVDNILLKLKQDHVDFVRLGKLSRIHPALHSHAADAATRHINTVDGLRQFYLDKTIIATTCLGMIHPVFSNRTFDVCIIDEASQVLEPACLAPMLAAAKFILVGDSKQLPPVVQSKQASNMGMSESLFSRLESCGATFELNLQYRMNKEIMAVCNDLTYDGALRCGSDEVASQCLPLAQDVSPPQSGTWLALALSDRLENSVVFLDTSSLPSARESKDNTGRIKNSGEAQIVLLLVREVVRMRVPLKNVGVIAPYRNQVCEVKRLLAGSSYGDVEVSTVDQYQGRDKSIIIISFTKSSSEPQTSTVGGELLKDIRRLNVAVTRARHKLILIGNAFTLGQYAPVSKIMATLRDRQLIATLNEHDVSLAV